MVRDSDNDHIAKPTAAAPAKAGQTVPAPRIPGNAIKHTTIDNDAPALIPNV
jgi:hypothetical protein